ncbi:hypothetical protein [Chitinophaga sp.]|uniref:hypothetical protein n=1 Tax=Chitinophaga sp. TaxID=1869181 RepID=UPI0031CF1304
MKYFAGYAISIPGLGWVADFPFLRASALGYDQIQVLLMKYFAGYAIGIPVLGLADDFHLHGKSPGIFTCPQFILLKS